jgi:hypothetical protein
MSALRSTSTRSRSGFPIEVSLGYDIAWQRVYDSSDPDGEATLVAYGHIGAGVRWIP